MERGHITQATFTMTIRCASCGNVMTLLGGKHVPPKLLEDHMDAASANQRTVFVQPCVPCMEKELGPARALKAALAQIEGK